MAWWKTIGCTVRSPPWRLGKRSTSSLRPWIPSIERYGRPHGQSWDGASRTLSLIS